MAVSTKGGVKRLYKTRKQFQAHCRSMTLQNKANHADGSWDSNVGPIHQMVFSGYNFTKKHVPKSKKD